MEIQNITLDGTTGFSAFGRSFAWDALLINRVSIGFDIATEKYAERHAVRACLADTSPELLRRFAL